MITADNKKRILEAIAANRANYPSDAKHRGNVPVLNWLGRHSLVVYLLHQPVLYGLSLLFF